MSEVNSADTSPDETPVDEPIQNEDFGLPLRQAREAAGLSLQGVADELKLEEKMLAAIENSRLDALPSQAYTQGYIRSYAKLLKISADEPINNYLALTRDQGVDLKPSSGYELQQHKQSRVFKIMSAGLVLVLLGFILLWIWAKVDMPDVNIPQAGDTEMPSADAADVTPDDTAQPETAEAPADSPAEVAPAPEVTEVIAPPAVPQSQAIEESAKVDKLALTTTAASWVEVTDANNERLYFRLMSENEKLDLSGKAPFRIFLGNAPEVSLKINGDAVDFSAYVRSNRIVYILLDKNGKISALKRSSDNGAAQ